MQSVANTTHEEQIFSTQIKNVDKADIMLISSFSLKTNPYS